MSLSLHVKRLSETAILPQRQTEGSAGYDLYAAQPKTIPAGSRGLVATDISIAVPHGYYGRIAPRSSLAAKMSIDVGAGVIDEDYRGPVGILLINFSDVDFVVEPGMRVAQLILEKIVTPDVVEVDALPETERGSGGFGSTGLSS
eukprot:TRINITY_DN9829_c0_g1_i1.p1 TRINITY_DN9829_c0_g1~~TRINITY_DN9829_c0_g1_i1.p1  ORF type:complete len:157 (-),score=48.23 TRINITY_DN9829_c0_g1_i1:39-473(-)